MQRRELTDLARARGYVLAGEFSDVVESGKDDDRPGLQALLAELYQRGRTWSIVLALDTSRIARRAAAAYWFEDRECRPRGVSVVYKNLPEMEDAERAIVKAVFHGVDEWHSLVSKRKGLAGMRENVRAGFRAGGRAPRGYRLEYTPTGAVREGSPVLKSRLGLGDDAARVQKFLRARAIGIPRLEAARQAGLEAPQTSLLGIERNALTYAGATVWNMLQERGRGGARYRPRGDWEIRRGTHPALIDEGEAEAILAALERRSRARTKAEKHDYLLAGLLCTPAGKPWSGAERDFYRAPGKARRILARRVDRAVVDCLAEDLAGDRLAQALLEHMRAHLVYTPDTQRKAAMRRKVDELDRKIRRFAELAADAEVAAPLLRTMRELEKERAAAVGAIEALEREASTQRALRKVSEEDVRAALRGMAVDLAAGRGVAELRDQVLQLLERVELDPAAPSELVLRYRPLPGLNWRPHDDANSIPVGAELLERRVKLAA